MDIRHAPHCLRTRHLCDSGAMLGGCMQVDVVGAHARRQDQLQLGRLLEQLLYVIAVGTMQYCMVLMTRAVHVVLGWLKILCGTSQPSQHAHQPAYLGGLTGDVGGVEGLQHIRPHHQDHWL